MNKNKHITFTNLVALFGIVLFAVVLLGCPTAAPEAKKKGGGDDGGGGGGDNADFSVSNEYIDFHSYYGEISNNLGKTFDEVVLVVSTSATPKAIGSIDATAKMVRKFDTDALKTRKIYIGWTDEYSTAKYNTFRDAATNKQHLVTGESDYTHIPWVMRANKPYYLHIYYDGKTFTKSFTTLDYPSTFAEAEAMFKGTSVANSIFNTGLNTVERKTTEPVVISSYVAWKKIVMENELGTAFEFSPDPIIIAQYDPDIGFVGTTTKDVIYIKFGDNSKLLFHPTSSDILDVFMIGTQSVLTYIVNLGQPETAIATGYLTRIGLTPYTRNMTIISE